MDGRKRRGFTVVELMIAMVIITILATVVYPTYTNFTLRSTRAVGITELMRVSQLQERYFVDNRDYGTLTELGFDDDTVGVNSAGNYVAEGAGVYDLTITPAPTVAGFTVQATATGSQTDDDGCTTMTTNNLGVQSPEACW